MKITKRTISLLLCVIAVMAVGAVSASAADVQSVAAQEDAFSIFDQIGEIFSRINWTAFWESITRVFTDSFNALKAIFGVLAK